jgi:DNA polymerase III subunit delta
LEAGEAPLRILGSLAWQYRRLWKVKEVVRQGGREGEAARTLRMDPYKVRAFLDQFPDAHLHEALRLFLEADAKLKGGSGGRPARVLEDALLRLCDRAQPNIPLPSPSRGTEAPQPVRARTISNVRTITRGKQTRS